MCALKRPERVQQDRPEMKLFDHLVGAGDADAEDLSSYMEASVLLQFDLQPRAHCAKMAQPSLKNQHNLVGYWASAPSGSKAARHSNSSATSSRMCLASGSAVLLAKARVSCARARRRAA